ncbi:hypothetical protein AB0A77_28495 [Streptomyces varsoviensis]|uniref:hypothetical protein n=1 Tax=Streptomyces varsoviensis TaxID=67373 RepID=UPI0033E710DE
MGSRLFVEVLDYAPTTLTHREKLLLAVLADDARDSTRITWNSVESPKILRRGKVSRAQVYEVIKALVAKGCLVKVAAGQKNGTAKYRIVELQCLPFPDTDNDPQRPETPDTDPDSQRPETPDTDDVQCPQTPDADDELQCPEFPDTDESQCPETPDVSVRESRTPTHSLSLEDLSRTATPATPDPPVTAQTIVGEWIDRAEKRPPSSVIDRASRQIKTLLDEGIDPYDIRRGMALWMAKGLDPAVIPSMVNQAMNATIPARQRSTTPYGQQVDGDVFARARARAAARQAAREAEEGLHQ